MANIKKNENTLKNLFERFPSLEGKLRAFANLRDGSLHYVRLAAIRAIPFTRRQTESVC